MLLWSKKENLPEGLVINHSSRARRISISVRPSGEVRLTIPKGTSESFALGVLESRREWIEAARKRIGTHSPIPASQVEELRRRAKLYLPQRITELSQRCGLQFNRLSIRVTRSRWGSCSSENNISLSVFLMILPPRLIDFVIIHELCHTRHHNHSPRFHEAVNQIVGGREKVLERELRQYCCGAIPRG